MTQKRSTRSTLQNNEELGPGICPKSPKFTRICPKSPKFTRINVQWPHWAHAAASQHQHPAEIFEQQLFLRPLFRRWWTTAAGCGCAAWMHISGSVIAHHSSGPTLHVFVLFFVKKNTFLLHHSCHICRSSKIFYTWRNTPAAAPAAYLYISFFLLFAIIMSFRILKCFCFVLCQKHFFIIPFAPYLPFFQVCKAPKTQFWVLTKYRYLAKNPKP
jgi:hypothetical protein